MSTSPVGGGERLGAARLRLPDVVAQSVGFMGPVFSAALLVPLVVGAGVSGKGAGIATPLAVIASTVGMVAIGWIIASYARRIHAAGALYDYVSDGFGDRPGFVAGWLYYTATMGLATAIVILIGGISSDFLQSTWSIGVPYWVLDLVYAGILLALIYCGVQISTRVQLVLVSVSFVVVTLFFLYIIAKGGTSGNSLTPFKPSASADGFQGILFGVIYGILLFVGFESAANLAEETDDPGRNVPRAIFLSLFVVGGFIVLASYAQAIGFGLKAKAWAGSPAPLFALADPKAFGSGWFLDLVQIIVILDIAAVGLGAAVTTTRGTFAMARDRRLPGYLARVSPRFGTPSTATVLLGAVSLAVLAATRLGHGLFPRNGLPEYFPMFAWLSGLGGLALVFVYLAVSLGALRGLRGFVNPVTLGLAVVVGALTAAGAVWGSVYKAPYPSSLWIWCIVGWVVVGAAIAVVKAGRGTFAVPDSKLRVAVPAHPTFGPASDVPASEEPVGP